MFNKRGMSNAPIVESQEWRARDFRCTLGGFQVLVCLESSRRLRCQAAAEVRWKNAPKGELWEGTAFKPYHVNGAVHRRPVQRTVSPGFPINNTCERKRGCNHTIEAALWVPHSDTVAWPLDPSKIVA